MEDGRRSTWNDDDGGRLCMLILRLIGAHCGKYHTDAARACSH